MRNNNIRPRIHRPLSIGLQQVPANIVPNRSIRLIKVQAATALPALCDHRIMR
jgi:hypothetical protein